MSPRYRHARDLTLGFLTLGAQAAARDVIDAAAQAGFGAAGLRISGRFPGDPWPSVDRNTNSLDRIRKAAADAKVRISGVSGYYISPAARLEHLLANVAAAEALGAPLIAQGCFDADMERVAGLLREYASAAEAAGIRIALEFMPMSELKTLGQAKSVIHSSGAGNVGLLIDSLHLARSGAGAADVSALDPASIFLTQLCDAPAQLREGTILFDEAMSGRMDPGDGGLDLAGLLNALPAEAEIELETPVVSRAGLSTAERARHAASGAQRFFDQHFSS